MNQILDLLSEPSYEILIACLLQVCIALMDSPVIPSKNSLMTFKPSEFLMFMWLFLLYIYLVLIEQFFHFKTGFSSNNLSLVWQLMSSML